MTHDSVCTHFAIPGNLNTPTGGYSYDREILALLSAHGVDARHMPLPASFPFPSDTDLAETVRALTGVPSGDVLLVDGLAYGVLPEAALARIAAPMIVLLHHPLGLETGLTEDLSCQLLVSEKAALLHARHIVVTSNTTADTLRELGFAPPPPVTIALPGTMRRTRATGSAGQGILEILSVGSLIPRKGYDVLVEAYARLPRGTWHATIAGSAELDPAYAVALKAQIDQLGLTEHITLLGALKPEALGTLYTQADIYALPSRYEGYGMAFASALSAGLPVVAARAGAVPETVPPQAGLLVPVDDVDALTEALSRLMTDHALRRKLSDAAWAYGQTLPSWDDAAQIFSSVIRTVVGCAGAN
jgi:glycosyltransferase involved in cell wall biosynthesis